jgi:RecA-family ATPase
MEPSSTSAVVEPFLKPDPEAMRTHVEHLFGGFVDYDDGLIELAWTDGSPTEDGRHPLRHAQLFPIDEIDRLVERACEINVSGKTNVYIGAALRAPDTAPFARAKDDDFYAATAYWADLDDKDANDYAHSRWQNTPPTLVVRTGKHPHQRHQLWWRLTEAETSAERVSAAVNGISQIMAGDGTVSNPARVMRLAGTIAWDHKPGRTPELTKIVALKNSQQPKAYMAEHVERVFPPLFKLSQVKGQRASPGPNVGVVREKNALGMDAGKVVDGREKHMTAVIMARLVDYCGQFGAEPTTEELFEHAWDAYERSTDLTSRPGRGRTEFLAKCQSTIRRFMQGKITGVPDLEAAVEAFRTRREAYRASTLHQAETEDDAPAAPPEASNDASAPILVSSLSGEPPERPWLVPEWVPAGVVSALYGDGGVGKTLIAQQLLYAAGLGAQWLGMDVPKMRGLGVFCEDDGDELHRRHNAIKSSFGSIVGNPFDETWIWPRVGFDNLLVTFDRDNRPAMSPFFQQVMHHVIEKRVGLLVLDTVADLFGGNEIIRGQVTFFIKSVCGSFIRQAAEKDFTLTVILLAHPSQSGRNTGSGESGSTAWNNSVRSRLYLMRPEDGGQDDRVLTRKKSNYAASGDDTAIKLVWKDGVIAVRDKASSGWPDKDACRKVLSAIREAWDAGQPWSTAPQTRNEGRFAPRRMSRTFGMPENVAMNMVETWIETGILAIDYRNRKANLKGLRVAGSID